MPEDPTWDPLRGHVTDDGDPPPSKVDPKDTLHGQVPFRGHRLPVRHPDGPTSPKRGEKDAHP